LSLKNELFDLCLRKMTTKEEEIDGGKLADVAFKSTLSISILSSFHDVCLCSKVQAAKI